MPEGYPSTCFKGNMLSQLFIHDGTRKYKTLDEVRKEFKWELNGEVRPYDKGKDTVESVAKAMGGNVVTFRIPWGKHSGEARPMLASVRGNCPWPGAVLSTDTSVMPCYFWRVADGNYNADPLLDGYARFAHYYYWLATCGAERENRASRLPLVFLVGRDDEGRTHRPELTAGDYDRTEVKETVSAPEAQSAWRCSSACGPAKAGCTSTTSTSPPPASIRPGERLGDAPAKRRAGRLLIAAATCRSSPAAASAR